MSSEQNIKAIERFGTAANKHDLDAVTAVFHRDVVDHDPAADQGPGPEGFRGFYAAFFQGFPDLQIELDRMVVDDDHIALAYTMSGTHQGDFQGIAPTGRRISIRGMGISRIEDGQIVERWGSSDEVGLLTQLGVKQLP